MPTSDDHQLDANVPGTQIVTYAIALAVPTDGEGTIDPVAFGGQTILDALAQRGVTVVGLVHHDRPDALFPGGLDQAR